MIVITKIETIEVPLSYAEIRAMEWDDRAEAVGPYGSMTMDRNEITELVEGRRFVRPSDGLDVVIGMGADVQDLLGIQYEAWEAMERSLSYKRVLEVKLRRSEGLVNAAEKILVGHATASFGQRLKWLFTGVK